MKLDEKSLDIYWAGVENDYIPWRELFLIPIIPALIALFLLIFVFKSDSANLGKLSIYGFRFDTLKLIFKDLTINFRYANRVCKK